MKMKIKNLSSADIGREVWYTPGYKEPEVGVLKSWNDKYIFVVYTGNNDDKRKNWQNYTAAATNPEELTFENPNEPEAGEK